MNENNPKPDPFAAVGQGLAQGSAIGLQAGCLGVALVIGALLLGLWLDGQLGTKPWFTLGLMLVSMPVSVYAMFRLVLRAARSTQMREPLDGEDKSSSWNP